ncbi:hypothetical protein ACL02S_23225 [Nocardia sp. 004]|uniref:hypothetical protein n=1 Tax=Nocardia sp. 004 TaxID=3385978 RepID=UPI0039A1B1D5
MNGPIEQQATVAIADHHGGGLHILDPITGYLAAQGLKVLSLPTWPTTEAIATHLAQVTQELLPELTLTGLLVREGSANQARWTPDTVAVSS